MSTPEQIREDIERTRAELGQDVDALADKVTPGKIAERQKTRLRQRFDNVKERVMGKAEDIGHSTSGAASSAGGAVSSAGHAVSDAVTDLPNKARSATQGSPIVVGAIAAGLGFLAASLIPVSNTEKRLASQVRDQAQPLVEKAQDVAKGMAADLKEPAQDAVQQVKEAATESAQTVKSEAQDSAQHVKENVSQSS